MYNASHDMEVAANHAHFRVITAPSNWEEFHEPLPFIFFGLFILWTSLLGIWTFNTWSKRRLQTSNLQWALAAVPALKSLALGLSFAFWYSCLKLTMCSFWIASGVFVTRIFFETSCFVCFLLISHGYCIMQEQLSASERQRIAGLASVLYLTLTGYKLAAVPQFAVQLQHIHDEDIHIMHAAVYTKYAMFKKFQGVMLIMIFAEVLMHAKGDGVGNYHLMRSLLQEWTEIGIFVYIGWIFRSKEIPPYFSVVPSMHFIPESRLPPIYKLEMNEKDFSDVDFMDWHIGVPTSLEKGEDNHLSMVVLVQNPCISDIQFCASQDELASRQHSAYYSSQFEKSNLGSCPGIFSASLSRHGSCETEYKNLHKMPSSEGCDWKRKPINHNMVGSRSEETVLLVNEL